MRDYVIDVLCPQLGIPVVEKNIEAYDVYTGDEAFMTGTPFCMLPVTSLNSISIGSGLVGGIFNQLISQWSSNVGIDIISQIQMWDMSGKQITLRVHPHLIISNLNEPPNRLHRVVYVPKRKNSSISLG